MVKLLVRLLLAITCAIITVFFLISCLIIAQENCLAIICLTICYV